jgi:HSP20 family protein
MAKAEQQSGEQVAVKETPSQEKDIEVSEPAEQRGARSVAPFWDFDRDFERAFENFFNRGWLRSPRWADFPSLRESMGEKSLKVNVIDRDNEVVVEAELPGVKKDDLDVSMTENTVTIKASTRKEEKEEKGDYRRREISTGFFSRTLSLPVAVQGEKAKAAFKDGILTLTLPKTEQAKKLSIKVD